jgi:uncharacterized damage-inducible protein DinB
MHTARTDWDTLIAQIPHRQLSELLGSGTWSIKDVIAHITECYHEDGTITLAFYVN